jgi:hypothetical protein
MQQDMDILRDIWNTIDPESHIGSTSEFHTNTTRTRHRNAEDEWILQQREQARQEVATHHQLGRSVPRRIEHFLRGTNERDVARRRSMRAL